MTPKEIGTIVLNVVVAVGAIAFVLAGKATVAEALAFVAALAAPSAAPVLIGRIAEALKRAEPPRGASVLEPRDKDGAP